MKLAELSIVDGVQKAITQRSRLRETVSVVKPVSRHTIEHTKNTLLEKLILAEPKKTAVSRPVCEITLCPLDTKKNLDPVSPTGIVSAAAET